MSIFHEERPSDSPFIETVTRGRTLAAGSSIRPAETHWHMVLVSHSGGRNVFVVGPLTTAGEAAWGEGAEILWIKFRLGVFLRHLPPGDLLDTEMSLPEAGSRSFWLNSSAWQFPDFENVETFIRRLARDGALVHDPLVSAVLLDRPPHIPSRTVRHRFWQATGLSRSRVYQIDRAQRAAALLQRGVPILEAVTRLGYYDQPHLTRPLKQWVGQTPAQLLRASPPA